MPTHLSTAWWKYNPILQKPTTLDPVRPWSWFYYYGPDPAAGCSYGQYAGDNAKINVITRKENEVYSPVSGKPMKFISDVPYEEIKEVLSKATSKNSLHKVHCEKCETSLVSDFDLSAPKQLHCVSCGEEIKVVSQANLEEKTMASVNKTERMKELKEKIRANILKKREEEVDKKKEERRKAIAAKILARRKALAEEEKKEEYVDVDTLVKEAESKEEETEELEEIKGEGEEEKEDEYVSIDEIADEVDKVEEEAKAAEEGEEVEEVKEENEEAIEEVKEEKKEDEDEYLDLDMVLSDMRRRKRIARAIRKARAKALARKMASSTACDKEIKAEEEKKEECKKEEVKETKADEKVEKVKEEKVKEGEEKVEKKEPDMNSQENPIPSSLVQDAEALRFEPLASLEAMKSVKAEDIDMILFGENGENPTWNISVAGIPAAKICLKDQAFSDDIRKVFCSEDYAVDLIGHCNKSGFIPTMTKVNAKFWANHTSNSKISSYYQSEASKKYEEERNKLISSFKTDLLDCINIVCAGLNKNFYIEGNPLKQSLFASLVTVGLPEATAMSVIEKSFHEGSPDYFSTLFNKSVEYMNLTKEARAEIAQAITQSPTIDHSKDLANAEPTTLGDRLAVASVAPQMSSQSETSIFVRKDVSIDSSEYKNQLKSAWLRK